METMQTIDAIRITLGNLLRWRACYPRERLEELYATPRTVREVLTLTEELWADVPPHDRVWTVLRDGVLPDRLVRLFACRCARRTLMREREAGREPDARSWASVEVAERYADATATIEELNAASYAASCVARDAARGEASYAASAAAPATRAASYAARYAASYAARDAANYAASYAARGAASYAARTARHAARVVSYVARAARAAPAASDAARAVEYSTQIADLLALIDETIVRSVPAI